MLQVVNHTPFSASLSVLSDTDGVESAFAIVKASFRITSEDPEVLAPQVPLLATDVFWGDPMATSLRAAGEFGLMKPATDVLLLGHAVAPEPGTRVADVSLSVGPVNRTVRVFGDRHWEKSGGQWRPSAPAAWDTMPLRWERAWGGIAPADPDAQGLPEHEPRNPVGVGIASRRDGPLEGQPLPNLEDPQALIAKPGDRPVPACFGPIPPTWLPRRDFAGTYDDGWTKKRAPYLPLDFDSRFFQVAPPALIAPGWPASPLARRSTFRCPIAGWNWSSISTAHPSPRRRSSRWCCSNPISDASRCSGVRRCPSTRSCCASSRW
jgi:hypothetical protein